MLEVRIDVVCEEGFVPTSAHEGRTCINESASGKYFKCSECGAELMQITPGWVALVSGRVNYCPNCGARVVDEEDNDG